MEIYQLYSIVGPIGSGELLFSSTNGPIAWVMCRGGAVAQGMGTKGTKGTKAKRQRHRHHGLNRLANNWAELANFGRWVGFCSNLSFLNLNHCPSSQFRGQDWRVNTAQQVMGGATDFAKQMRTSYWMCIPLNFTTLWLDNWPTRLCDFSSRIFTILGLSD